MAITHKSSIPYDLQPYKVPIIGRDLDDYGMRGNPNLRESLYKLNQTECIEKIVRLEHEVNRLHSELSNAHNATRVITAMRENLTGQGVRAKPLVTDSRIDKLLLLIPN